MPLACIHDQAKNLISLSCHGNDLLDMLLQSLSVFFSMCHLTLFRYAGTKGVRRVCVKAHSTMLNHQCTQWFWKQKQGYKDAFK